MDMRLKAAGHNFGPWTGAKKVDCGSVSCQGDPLTVEQSASLSVNRLIWEHN